MQTTPVACINAFKCTASSESGPLGLGRKSPYSHLFYCDVTPDYMIQVLLTLVFFRLIIFIQFSTLGKYS